MRAQTVLTRVRMMIDGNATGQYNPSFIVLSAADPKTLATLWWRSLDGRVSKCFAHQRHLSCVAQVSEIGAPEGRGSVAALCCCGRALSPSLFKCHKLLFPLLPLSLPQALPPLGANVSLSCALAIDGVRLQLV